jgi:hypothetical protein
MRSNFPLAVAPRAAASSPPQNAVKIGPDYFPISTLREARDAWVACRDQNGWGASESPLVTACVDRKLYRISYNGRVWDAGTGAEVKPS